MNYRKRLNQYLFTIIILIVLGILPNVLKGVSTINDEQQEITPAVSYEDNTADKYQEATLIRVVDGDTLLVKIDGEKYRVRLIGIDTPESVAPEESGKENTEEGVEASEYTKKLLESTTTVYLQKDVSETDQYDRLLRYVWLEIPEDSTDIDEISNKMLNGILLRDNVAEVVVYEPDVMYVDQFQQICNK